VPRRQGLGLDGVERGDRHAAGVESTPERVLIDDRAARDVHEMRAGLHCAEERVVEEAARVAIVLEQVPINETVLLDDLAEKSGVARRKTRIVLVLLKRHGLVREYRGGSWERLQSRLTSVDLSADLTDYEARRLQDRAKLRAMINYCQSAQCRTRFILDYFGEDVEPDWRCENCDACDGAGIVRFVRAEYGETG
jgi:hypothetical protein